MTLAVTDMVNSKQHAIIIRRQFFYSASLIEIHVIPMKNHSFALKAESLTNG